MKKILKHLLVLLISIISIVSVTSCSIYDNSEKIGPETFDDFANSLFISLIGQDELTCNFYFVNRQNYGLEAYEPSLYVPQPSSIIGTAMINLYFGRVKLYDYNQLNDDQKMTYNLIVDLLTYINEKTSEMSYLDNNYLGTYLGYQAQLPLLLSEYNFRCELDIQNYMKYLELVPSTFEGYYNFEVLKADAGYGMADYVINNVVDQCSTFVDSIESGESFMFAVTNNKINSCTFLDEIQKEAYINQNNELVNTSLKEGYQFIEENLPNLLGRATNSRGLAYYVTEDGTEIGKKYYTLMFQRAVGYDCTIEEAIEYIDQKIEEYSNQKDELYAQLTPEELQLIVDIVNDDYNIMEESPEAQLDYYLSKLDEDFPSMDVIPTVEFKFVDKSMEDNYSPASYINSPLDNDGNEVIYLNPADIYHFDEDGQILGYETTYLYTTIGHEGIPGHLYQHLYFNQKDVNIVRKVLSCSGYTEGWATYAEMYTYNYLRDELGDKVVDYLLARENLNAAVYSRIDMGIQYEGWTEEDLFNCMKDYYQVKKVDDVVAAYQQMVEIPTNYQKYFYTYLKFVDMYNAVKASLGESFNAKEFHQTILDLGSVPLKYVEQAINEKYNLSI